MHLPGWFAVNFTLGVRNPLEHGDGFLFHPVRERALRNQFLDLAERSIFVVVMVFMFMIVVVMVVIMMMRMAVVVIVTMVVMVGQMHIEFHAGDAGFFLARGMEVITVDAQFLQLVFELMCV